jgi:hypothetical protein
VLRLLLAALPAAFLLPACAGKPPEILRVHWQVTLVDDRESGQRYTAVSLFVRPNDPDGFDDLSELYLIDDRDQLCWRLGADSWQTSGTAETWIGSNGLGMPDGSPLPAGEYRVLLRDVGGESAEQTVRLPEVSAEELARLLPQVEVRGGEIRVSGRASAHQLWLYDRNGSWQTVRPMIGKRQSVAELLAAYPQLAGGFRFKVYAESGNAQSGAVSGLYFWEP